MLSNSDVPAMHELYAGWRLVTVSAARCINSSGAKRGPVGELLVKSW
jgi:site-specific DNA-adenine methylase